MGKKISKDNAIVVKNVSMHFNMATEKVDSLRDYLTKALSHQLFYKDFVAVDNVSFEVKKGDVFGIVGTNGSGKSTLLKMIAGVLEPTYGEIITQGKMAPLIELGAGFDGELTGRENIYLNGALLGYKKEFIDEKFKSIVDFSEIGKFLDMPLKNYSSGMTARIAFAIATAVIPDILIADEILAVGDFLFQQKCEMRIKELMESGTTVLLVSHSIDQIEHLCNRVLWIEKGKPIMIGNTFEVCNAYRSLQNDPNRTIKQEFQIVAEGRCSVCGKQVQFRDEPGMTYKTESYCSACGSLLRTSDLMSFYLKNRYGLKDAFMDDIKDKLADMKIFYFGYNDVLSSYLKQFPGFKSLGQKRLHDCVEMIDNNKLPYIEEGSLDLIITQRILSYVKQPEKVFQYFASILKENGCLMIQVPVFEQKKTEKRSADDRKIVLNNQLLVTEWGIDIKEILEKYGFKVKMQKVRNWYNEDEITDLDATYKEFIETHPYFYFKFNSWVIMAEKLIQKEEQ